MSAVIPNGLEYFLLGKWEPCKKIKYTAVGAKIALSKIGYLRKKHKQQKHRRKEHNSYFCEECKAFHLTSIK